MRTKAGLAFVCLALAAADVAHAETSMAPPPDFKVLSGTPAARGTTFVVSLGNAPFPVGAGAVDHRAKPFWHGADEAGRRFRISSEGQRYFEAEVYSNARVLFHAAKGFDPAKPFRLVLFLHGHGSEIERTVARDLDVPGQLDRADTNAVLIAPQLALDAADSAPGKFAEPGRAAAFFDEAEGVLQRMLGGAPEAWRRAPIVIAAYSGGYRAAAQILDRGGLDGRIAGLVMLDAFYADAGLYAGWLARNHHHAFLYALYSKSSAEETEALKVRLIERNIAYRIGDDGGPIAGIRFVPVETPHGEVPRLGPPAEPLGAVLRRLER